MLLVVFNYSKNYYMEKIFNFISFGMTFCVLGCLGVISVISLRGWTDFPPVHLLLFSAVFIGVAVRFFKQKLWFKGLEWFSFAALMTVLYFL